MIREKAYQMWEANGRPTGAADEHWFAAEALLREALGTTLGGTDKNDGKRPPPLGLRQLNP